MQSDIVDFVQNVLERNRIRVKIFSIEECYSPFPFDLGLRKQLLGSFSGGGSQAATPNIGSCDGHVRLLLFAASYSAGDGMLFLCRSVSPR